MASRFRSSVFGRSEGGMVRSRECYGVLRQLQGGYLSSSMDNNGSGWNPLPTLTDNLARVSAGFSYSERPTAQHRSKPRVLGMVFVARSPER